MIYCVEDDKDIRELIVYTLQSTGFDAQGFADGADLFRAIATALPRLILLDIMLPGDDGIAILKKLKAGTATKNIPVIMATAKTTEYDKVSGLELGADDYIAKPFGMMEMVARVKAVLRRCEPQASKQALRHGALLLNAVKRTVSINNTPVDLTLKEFELLQVLMANPGAVFTRDQLMDRVWGYEYSADSRTVDVHIRTLRAKLGEGAECVQTVRGVGYRFGDYDV